MLFDPDAPGLLFEGRDVSTTGRLAPFSCLLNHTKHPKQATSTYPKPSFDDNFKQTSSFPN